MVPEHSETLSFTVEFTKNTEYHSLNSQYLQNTVNYVYSTIMENSGTASTCEPFNGGLVQ